MPSHIRQVDIAHRLGLNRSTVTRALKGDPMIAEDTRRAVQEAAEALGYIPNTLGRALATGYHHVIGLMLMHGFYFGMDGVSQALRDTDWALQLAMGHGPDDRDVAAVRDLLSRRVAGLMFHMAFTDALHPAFALCRSRGIPTVLEGMHTPFALQSAESFAQVTFDFEAGMELAVRHLAAQGHTRIGMVYHSVPMWPRAFASAIERVGVTGEAVSIATPPEDFLSSLLDGAWSGAQRPSALLLSSLPLAIQFDRYRARHQLRVPDDLAVMMVQYHTLWVPEIHENYPYLIFDDVDTARIATQLLIAMIEGAPAPPAPVLVPGYLRMPTQAFRD